MLHRKLAPTIDHTIQEPFFQASWRPSSRASFRVRTSSFLSSCTSTQGISPIVALNASRHFRLLPFRAVLPHVRAHRHIKFLPRIVHNISALGRHGRIKATLVKKSMLHRECAGIFVKRKSHRFKVKPVRPKSPRQGELPQLYFPPRTERRMTTPVLGRQDTPVDCDWILKRPLWLWNKNLSHNWEFAWWSFIKKIAETFLL